MIYFASYIVFMIAGIAIGGLFGLMFQGWWWGKGKDKYDAVMQPQYEPSELAKALEAIANAPRR